MTILEKLQNRGIPIYAACGGEGTCGKCGVLIKKPSHEPIHVLACATTYEDDMEIILDEEMDVGNFQMLHLYEPQKTTICNRDEKGYGLAVDIGTTTLAFEVVEMATGKRVANHAVVNSQCEMGADVITRIKLATQGQQRELNRRLLANICWGIIEISRNNREFIHNIRHMVIVGNTTMLHLLLNLSCESLGQFPFTPVWVDGMHRSFKEIFNSNLLECDVCILPCISAFVGADIVAGIHFCGTSSNFLLIDLGTNGEMALYTQEQIWVTAAAAGPAFEAGNILHGMASVPGAIARVTDIYNGAAVFETIADVSPEGLCGTGVVDITAQLRKHNIIDETGFLDDAYFNGGFPIMYPIVFMQKDIREVQLAKSAVRSGIEILLETAGYTYNDISHVYLAGGLGYKLNLENALILGIIPKELKDKIIPVGNAALGGCVCALLNKQAEADMSIIVKRTTEINLSTHPKFNDYFIEHMMF